MGWSLGSERELELACPCVCVCARETGRLRNKKKEWTTNYYYGQKGEATRYCLQIQVHWADGGVFTAFERDNIARLDAACRLHRGDTT